MAENPKAVSGKRTATSPKTLSPAMSELMDQIKLLNVNLERDIHSRASWRLALRNGLVGAIGGLVGTTVLVGLLVRFVGPLKQIAELRPVLERIANQPPNQNNRDGE